MKRLLTLAVLLTMTLAASAKSKYTAVDDGAYSNASVAVAILKDLQPPYRGGRPGYRRGYRRGYGRPYGPPPPRYRRPYGPPPRYRHYGPPPRHRRPYGPPPPRHRRHY